MSDAKKPMEEIDLNIQTKGLMLKTYNKAYQKGRSDMLAELRAKFPDTAEITQWVSDTLACEGIRPNEAWTAKWIREKIFGGSDD